MNPYDNVGTARLSDQRLRPALPAGRRLPGRRGRARHRRAAHRTVRPTDAAGRRRGGGHPGHPRAPGRAAGLQRARRHRPRAGRRRAAPSCAGAGRDDERYPQVVLDAVLRRAVRPDPAGRGGRGDAGAGARGRSGRTTSFSARAPPRPVEEKCRPTRRCAGARDGPAPARPAAAAPAEAARPGAARSTEPGARRRRWSSTWTVGPAAAPMPAGPRAAAAHRAHRRAGRAGRGRRPARTGPTREVRGAGPADRAPGWPCRRPRRDPPRRARRRARSPSLPYRGGSDDIDLDRTIEVLTERPVPGGDGHRRPRADADPARGGAAGGRVRVDARARRSGSPPPPSARWPASCSRDDLAVVAFWSDAAVLLPLGAPVPPLRLLDQLLRDPGPRADQRRASRCRSPPRELARSPARRRPGRAAVRLRAQRRARTRGRSRPGCRGWTCCSRPTASTTWSWAGAGAAGRGRLLRVRHHRDVAPALSRVFAA